jgi:hypothetical protein
MALSELELKKAELVMARFLKKRRPPTHLRHQLDLGYRVSDQSIEIFESRQDWEDPVKFRESPIAKATLVKRTGRWKVYWMRADRRWDVYQPSGDVASLDEFAAVVDEDAHGCFWG